MQSVSFLRLILVYFVLRMYDYNSEDDILSPNLDEMLGCSYVNNNSKLVWHPNVTVTSYDSYNNDSEDYADSDSPI